MEGAGLGAGLGWADGHGNGEGLSEGGDGSPGRRPYDGEILQFLDDSGRPVDAEAIDGFGFAEPEVEKRLVLRSEAVGEREVAGLLQRPGFQGDERADARAIRFFPAEAHTEASATALRMDWRGELVSRNQAFDSMSPMPILSL